MVVLIIPVLLYLPVLNFIASYNLVNHTWEAEYKVQRNFSRIRFAESGVRAYAQYFEISITGNAMGFPQVFAYTWFQLFYRPHHNKEIPGTGNGLTVCKQILENRPGFTSAENKEAFVDSFPILFPQQHHPATAALKPCV